MNDSLHTTNPQSNLLEPPLILISDNYAKSSCTTITWSSAYD